MIEKILCTVMLKNHFAKGSFNKTVYWEIEILIATGEVTYPFKLILNKIVRLRLSCWLEMCASEIEKRFRGRNVY